MSNWPNDIREMHAKYGVHETMRKFNDNQFRKFLRFRLNFLREELNETEAAALGVEEGKDIDAEEVVDGLIDLCVVAIGTLDAFGVDAQKAWDEVLRANMNKQVGIKEGRPNPLGLPDLVKPIGWQAPDHRDNHGSLTWIEKLD